MMYFTKTNEWVAVEGRRARIGLTIAAQEHLGDVTFVDLPSPGKNVKREEILATIESVKAVIELYAPLSGTVTAIHEALRDKPEILTEKQDGEAWVLELELSDPSEVDQLLDQAAYEAFLAQK